MNIQRKCCLIFNNYPLKITDGGPSGFLAQNLAGTLSENYRLSKVHQMTWPQNRILSFLLRKYKTIQFRSAFKKNALPLHRSYLISQIESARHSFKQESGQSYPVVWFHDVGSLYACLDLLDERQCVILQPHCPELPSDDVVSCGGDEDANLMKHAESAAFARANICVLPNEYVLPIYAPLIQPTTRMEYLLSGCMQMKAEGHLPLDPKFIYYLYLGRRVAIKGFDLVLEAFQKAHEQDASLRLVVVGRGEKISVPGVIDIGYSNNPAAWLFSCDYLISANRQSYFDLSVMEALSLGTPLIINRTGGHCYFKDIDSAGIYSLPNADVQTLTQAILTNHIKRFENRAASDANKKLFHEQFDSCNYRIRLNHLLTGILQKQNKI